MSPAVITLLFLLFAIIMFVTEKLPLGVTSMIVCVGLVVTGVLNISDAFKGFIDSNVILFVAMFIVGGALFETGMANEIGGIVTRFAKSERMLIIAIMVIVGIMSGFLVQAVPLLPVPGKSQHLCLARKEASARRYATFGTACGRSSRLVTEQAAPQAEGDAGSRSDIPQSVPFSRYGSTPPVSTRVIAQGEPSLPSFCLSIAWVPAMLLFRVMSVGEFFAGC